jgi:hypothetical protein
LTGPASGAFRYAIGDSSVPLQHTLDYGTYRAAGRTIVPADDDSLTFTYDATGDGMYVSIDKVTVTTS